MCLDTLLLIFLPTFVHMHDSANRPNIKKPDVNTLINNGFKFLRVARKFWLIDQLHLESLRKEIENISHNLKVNYPSDERKSRLYEIYGLLKEGEFPDLSKYDLVEGAIVIADLTFIEFLKSEQQRLLAEQIYTTVKVPVELTTSTDQQEYSLLVKIPPAFFEKIHKDALQNELQKVELPKTPRVTEPKLYTRKETAKIMNASVNTIDNLTKEGILKCHRIGNTSMKRYKWEDIENALEVVDMRMNRRFADSEF